MKPDEEKAIESIRENAPRAKARYAEHEEAITEERAARALVLATAIEAAVPGLEAEATKVKTPWGDFEGILLDSFEESLKREPNKPQLTELFQLYVDTEGRLWEVTSESLASISLEDAILDYDLSKCLQALVKKFSTGHLARGAHSTAIRVRAAKLRKLVDEVKRL